MGDCNNMVGIRENKEPFVIKKLSNWSAVVTLVLFGLFAIALAKLFDYIRKCAYKSKNNLDMDFDAGGRVSIGLTATTIVSQWTWAATLLQSSAVTTKYGISGAFWYAAGATIQILLFSTLAVQMKIRSPGAKTFLQLIHARFGRRTHIVYCGFALLNNIVVTAMLMLGGVAVMTTVVEDMNIEFATVIIAAVIGSYTYIGGLGATFYVSYFNTAVIFIVIIIFSIKVYTFPDDNNPLGSPQKVYDYLNCISTANETGNLQDSYVTFVSYGGFVFGIINIVGNFGTVFVDQSYWQSAVAAKPMHGVLGFLAGGLVWFAVPFTFATTMGLSYVALGVEEGYPLLNQSSVDAGLVPPAVASSLMGTNGQLLILILVIMAVCSTGSAEVIAVTSILVYDVYRLNLKPYRATSDTNSCLLCGRQRGRLANPRDKCTCHSMTVCVNCRQDDEYRESCKRSIKPEYKCSMHGAYRKYTDYLSTLKNWCMMWTTLTILPITMILDKMDISLSWVYSFMGVLVGSAVIPISLSMYWSKLNSVGMISGSVAGLVIGLTSWLITASLQEGGIAPEYFIQNTGYNMAMLTGNLCSILSGGVITVIVSLVTNRQEYDANEIWENVRDIDNPLTPWAETYARDLDIQDAHELERRPSLATVELRYRGAKLTSWIGSSTLAVILIVVWPLMMIPTGVLSLDLFVAWVDLSRAWAIIAGAVIIVLPVVNEFFSIREVVNERSRVANIDLPSHQNGHRSLDDMHLDSKAEKNGSKSSIDA